MVGGEAADCQLAGGAGERAVAAVVALLSAPAAPSPRHLAAPPLRPTADQAPPAASPHPTQCGIVCPTWFAESVARLAADDGAPPELRSFGAQMQALLALQSTYAELEALKKVAGCVVGCAQKGSSGGDGSGDERVSCVEHAPGLGPSLPWSPNQVRAPCVHAAAAGHWVWGTVQRGTTGSLVLDRSNVQQSSEKAGPFKITKSNSRNSTPFDCRPRRPW